MTTPAPETPAAGATRWHAVYGRRVCGQLTVLVADDGPGRSRTSRAAKAPDTPEDCMAPTTGEG